MSTNRRRRTVALNLLGIFLAGMGMSVFLVPIVAHGPSAAEIVKVFFTALYALFLGFDTIKEVSRGQN